MARSLLEETKVTLCKTAVAAGAADVTDATVIDMLGYEGVQFHFHFGTITAGAATSCKLASLATASPTLGTDDVAGSSVTVVDTDDDTVVIIDLYRPRLRYVRPGVKRATQNAVVNSIVAVQYGAKKGSQRTLQDTATVTHTKQLISPANGTA